MYLFRVSEVSPEGVVNVCCSLLRVTGHGFNKHLQRALQQHVHASVVVIVISANVERQKKLVTQKRQKPIFKFSLDTDRIP